MVGKQLSALLQILRSNGVQHYQTPDLTLVLGPKPPPTAPRGAIALDLSPEALAEDEKEPTDWRFALEEMGSQERLTRKHFGNKTADPRRVKARAS